MNKNGFTLIELLIVMGIISTLSVMFVATYPSGRKKARDTQRKNDLKQYQTALERYADKNSGLYPGSVPSANAVDVCSQLAVTACPNDPVSGINYKYEATRTDYHLWAQLENPDSNGDTRYFVTCSNGKSGETIDEPAGVPCPI